MRAVRLVIVLVWGLIVYSILHYVLHAPEWAALGFSICATQSYTNQLRIEAL